MTEYGCGIQHSVEGDEHGYVILRDVMGSDRDIANSARISYDNQGASQDRALLRYLLRHKHTSPFEMAEVKWEIKMPIFVARQWIRHRTANVNEVSARYTQLPAEMFVPEDDAVREQSQTNKQGRGDPLPPVVIRGQINTANAKAYQSYKQLLEDGLAREMARGVLPLNIYTKMIWKIDLHNLFHFLKLRLDPHAQKEIRMYAEVMERIVQDLFPFAYEAFVDYSKEAYTCSRMELTIIRDMFKTMQEVFVPQHDYDKMCKDAGMSDREIADFKKEFIQ